MSATLERSIEQSTRLEATRFYGKYRGKVTDVDDPERNCRVMAQVPGVMGETEVGWALPAFAFAGPGYGQVLLPEVGDMVWIEFEAGNLNYPIWTGAFFIAGDRPEPSSTGARVIVSKKGHQLVLDDDEDTVSLKHAMGAQLEMTATEITLSIGANKMVMSLTAISFNEGVVKIGPAGVSLAQGAMTLGVPPV